MKIKFLLIIGFIICLYNVSYSQNPGDVVLNEIMYAPTPSTSEWFEIYNNTSGSFNLSNWKWKDATATLRIITTQNINLPANSFAVICQDSAAFRSVYTGFSGILLQPANGWSALNNTGDQLILFNSAGSVIDSINFTLSWGGSSGSKSLERINSAAPTNQQSNWGTSIAVLGATPGLRNSISPLNNDLKLNLISFSSTNPVIGTTLQITANIKNTGLLSAGVYSVSFYEDYNKDSIPSPGELIVTLNSAGPLVPGDSVNFTAPDVPDSLGLRQYLAVVSYVPDEDTMNNKKTGTVNVISAGGFDSLIVNEIMYAPTANTGKEWFEIYNKSANTVSLTGWKWKDATATQHTITSQNISIAPGGFAVICEDSAAVKSFYPLNTGIYLQSSGWSALNNTGDNIVLFNSTGSVIDSITFLSPWGGSTGNKSLERISYTQPSNQQTNWGTNVNSTGATPNRVNSVTPKPNDLSLGKISFSVSVPALGDTLGIIAQVKNRGLNIANTFTVSFYDDYNRDSIPTPGELKAVLNSVSPLSSGDSAQYTYRQLMDSAGYRQFIAVVNYAPDEDTSNNKKTAGIEVSGGSTAGRVLINEIMYNFPAGECEWVELFNNSDSVVNLINWKIQDNGTTQVNITSADYFLNPDSYVVLSQSSVIYANHPGLDSSKIIIVSSLPSLNNDGDAVIIYKINGALSDRLDYLPAWGGDKSSLERININGVSNDSSNWATSVDCEKSTPAKENSLSSAVHYTEGALIVNEIMATPLTGNAEWFELYNPTSQAVNIAKWLMYDLGGKRIIADTCSAFIKPGSYAVIAADTTIFNLYPYLKTPDSTQKVFIAGSIGLNNDADLVKITDIFKTKIDSVYYLDDWYNPNLPGSGRISGKN